MRNVSFAAGILLCCVVHNELLADLLPKDIAIIANAGNAESKTIAAYYARERAIPAGNILSLNFTNKPEDEVLDRQEWEKKVRPLIRKWLRDKGLTNKIKCFVTVWGVPLKIAKSNSDFESRRSRIFLQAEQRLRIDQMNRIFKALHELENAQPEPYVPMDYGVTLEDMAALLKQILADAQKRIAEIADAAQKQTASITLQNLFVATVGANGYIKSLATQLQTRGNNNPAAQAQLDRTRGRSTGLQECRVFLENATQTVERDQAILAFVDRSDGLNGSLIWLGEQLKTLEKNESHASFDSELALVAWSGYSLARWQPNYLHARFRNSSIELVRPTYMVARIDAPSLSIARRMIDDSKAVEETGLTGKIYLDGRGLAKSEDQVRPGTHADYDRSLALTADLLKKYTSMEVVYNTEQELFKEGECKEVALYCGWYSLGKYVDAFEWNKGAVGYHIASSEASTLKKQNSTVWCKKMLEDGVCATLGPVYEPYVVSFPRPEQFFVLLLSGKYTLAECYALTKPFNSWTMTLLGDPLYNPFKNAPQIKVDQLEEPLKSFVEGTGT